jgi:hypothetical protein
MEARCGGPRSVIQADRVGPQAISSARDFRALFPSVGQRYLPLQYGHLHLTLPAYERRR